MPTIIGGFAGNVNFTANGDTLSRSVSGSTTGTAPMTLTVTKNGSGGGTVTSAPAGIACGTTCTDSAAAGTQMTLTATAASGSTFAGWGGACSGTGACVVTLSANRAVTATFNASASPAPPAAAPGTLSVTRIAADATGVTFAVAWAAVSGARSYSYDAAFADGTAARQGTVTGLSFQLRMPYHASGAVFDGYVCLRSINAAGQQSSTPSCNRMPVPARAAATPPTNPVPVPSSLSRDQCAWPGARASHSPSTAAASSPRPWCAGTALLGRRPSSAPLSFAPRSPPLTSPPSRIVPVSVFTPAPGGGTSGTLSFTVSAPATAAPTAPRCASDCLAPPGSARVTRLATDTGGVTFTVAWAAVSGATSYSYVAMFGDGTAARQGTVTGLSFQLRMPYHVSGAASAGFVCVRSINAARVAKRQSIVRRGVSSRALTDERRGRPRSVDRWRRPAVDSGSLSLELRSISLFVNRTRPKICVHSETTLPTTWPHLPSEFIAA